MDYNTDLEIEGTEGNEREGSIEERPNISYWLSQLDEYDKTFNEWKKQTERAWKEYLKDSPMSGRNPEEETYRRTERKLNYPIFWAAIRTIQPAIYSRTPRIIVEKAFTDLRDNIARLGSLSLERIANYAIRCFSFDRTFYSIRDDFIIGGKSTPRAHFKAEFEKQIIQQFDPVSQTLIEIEQEMLTDIKCSLMPLHYCDYKHTASARCFEEITWMSFDSIMTKKEIEDRFGEEIADTLNYSVGDDKDGKRYSGSGGSNLVCTITEIWDKKNKKVYWIDKNSKNDWLDIKDDPYQLRGFFPCAPFIIGTVGPDNLVPTPDHVQLEPILSQVSGLADRIRRLLIAIKKRGFYDAGVPELATLNDLADEADYIGINNLRDLLGGGGLENIVKTFPTDELAKGVAQLKAALDDFENKFYDLWGIPDIYRGITDPNETLGAQQMKGKHMAIRFSHVQREFQRVVRDSIEILIDLWIGLSPDYKLAEICGVSYWSIEDQQNWPQVLQLIRNDNERLLRIEIETDSTITANLNSDIEQANYVAKTLVEGISSIAQVGQSSPELMPTLMEALLLVIRKLPYGKNIEEQLEQGIEKILAPKAPQQAPLDPALLKVQAQAQLEQQKVQAQFALQQQKAQSELALQQQKAQNELAMIQSQAQADIIREDRKAAQSSQLEQLDAYNQQTLKQLEADLKKLQATLSLALQQKKVEDQKEVKMTELAIKANQTPEQTKGEDFHLHIGG